MTRTEWGTRARDQRRGGGGGRDRKQGEDDKRSAEKERSAVSWPKMIAVIKTTGHNHAGTVAVPENRTL